MNETFNPFPGPQPYREADRDRFLGREKLTQRLVNRILATPCVTLFGPSGAGKSSLMQAAVIPELRNLHDFRTVSVDTWKADKTPLDRLVGAMFTDLELGSPSPGLSSRKALDEAVWLAARYSDRPILIYLDQLEQLLFPARSPRQADELFEALAALARLPVRGVHLMLSLREDYLGCFRDRVRGLRSLQDTGFRVGPLTVKEMARVVCQLAAMGKPAQQWELEELEELMFQVRSEGQTETGEVEVQAAFAQIVCRALWEEGGVAKDPAQRVPADLILHRYLETTLDALGPLRAEALTLLEDCLIASDGSRTLLTEEEAQSVLREGTANQVLVHLEQAAVLHAKEHHNSRYFELGHDWLAKKVLELKRERQRQQRLHKLASRVVVTTGVALVLGLGIILLVGAQLQVRALNERVFGLSMMDKAQDQLEIGAPATAIKLLLEVKHPERLKGWNLIAQEALDSNFLELTLKGSGIPLNAASYSPDGQYIVTAAEDGSVRLRRADGSAQPRLLGTHKGPVRSAAFSPDGQRLVTASEDGTARVWWVDGSGPPLVFKGPRGAVLSAAFSPDGQRLVTASEDGTARVWWVGGSGPPLVFEGHQGAVLSAAFSPDGKRLVTASEDKTARLWQVDGSRQPLVFKDHQGAVLSAAFSPDGQRLVTASEDKTARLWWAENAQQLRVFEGHQGAVFSAAFNGDGERLVTASEDETARVWQVEASREPIVFEGHTRPVRSAAFSPDGQYLVTASDDGTARVWRIEEEILSEVLEGYKYRATFAAFSPDGMLIATASQDTTARFWWTNGWGEPRLLSEHEGPVLSVTFSSDSQRLVTTSSDKTARVWQVNPFNPEPRVLPGHGGPVTFAAFSPDDQYIVTTSRDETAWVWGPEGSEPLFKLPRHKGAVTSAAFSPDGASLLTADSMGSVREWRIANQGRTHRVVAAHESSVNSVTYSSSGRFILTASDDGTARLWRADGSGAIVFKGHTGPVHSAAFSPDDQFIVTASEDRTVRVWRVDDPRPFYEFKVQASPSPFVFAAFSPNGQRLITVSKDGSVRLRPLQSTPQSITELQEELREDNQDCLSADLRQAYLDESERVARERYEACERRHDRAPTQPWASRSERRTAGSPKGI